MNRIRILPEDVVNKIAAGEVVERPASVVKELIENSLDAGATRINVEFEQAGKKLIRVGDNGWGMSREDAMLAVKRHATSKITSFSDLHSIRTLGFRGEALPSICAVSRFRIVTRTPDAKAAIEISVEGEKVLYARECAGAPGTMIEIADLFYNLPARRKFLKADSTEQAHIVRTIEECALPHPETGFSAVGNKKIIFNSPPSSRLEERAADIIGRSALDGMIKIEDASGKIKITGLVSAIERSQPNKNIQYFFVNKRPVMNRMLSQAVYDAYRDALPIGRHPAVVLLMDIDPAAIDINVHPTKRIVKFSDEFEIYGQLNAAVSRALSGRKPQEAPAAGQIKQQLQTPGAVPELSIQPDSIREKPQTPYVQTALADTGEPARRLPGEASAKTRQAPAHYRIIGQLYNTYVIAESPEGLVLFDQHAANERILYEKFLSASEKPGSTPAQELLMPFTIDLALHEIEVIKPHLSDINSLGFEASEFGRGSIVFRALPAIVGNIGRVNDFFREFAAAMIENFNNPSMNLRPREKIIRAACRAAVKASDWLSFEEMEALVEDLMECAQPNCCPHGRPTMIKITAAELEKKFLRR